jgi:hypothetical protein
MLEDLFHVAWMCGTAGSVALLIYGGWLVWLFQGKASIVNQRTVARLALYESLLPSEQLAHVKEAALAL